VQPLWASLPRPRRPAVPAWACAWARCRPACPGLP